MWAFGFVGFILFFECSIATLETTGGVFWSCLKHWTPKFHEMDRHVTNPVWELEALKVRLSACYLGVPLRGKHGYKNGDLTPISWDIPYDMGISWNGDTPKWIVYNGKSYLKGWFRGTTISGNHNITPRTMVTHIHFWLELHFQVRHTPIQDFNQPFST